MLYDQLGKSLYKTIILQDEIVYRVFLRVGTMVFWVGVKQYLKAILLNMFVV